MKKFVYCFLFISAMLLNACGDRIIEEYYEENVNVNSFSKTFTVYNSGASVADYAKWQYYETEHGSYFFCRFAVPQLTAEVLKYGIMTCNLRYPVEDNLVESPLPFSDFFVRNGIRWEEQVTVEYEVGYVTFIMKYDDQAQMLQYYDEYEFVLRLLW